MAMRTLALSLLALVACGGPTHDPRERRDPPLQKIAEDAWRGGDCRYADASLSVPADDGSATRTCEWWCASLDPDPGPYTEVGRWRMRYRCTFEPDRIISAPLQDPEFVASGCVLGRDY